MIFTTNKMSLHLFYPNKVKRKAALGINRFIIQEKKLSNSAVNIQSQSVAISVPELTFKNSGPCGKSHGLRRLLLDSGRWPMTFFS